MWVVHDGRQCLRHKITTGLSKDRDYFAELFSRYSEKFSSIIPRERSEKMLFYKKLITDVLAANMHNTARLNELVRRCMVEEGGSISGLRRAESLLLLYND